jgi:outer membrane protein
MRADPSGHAGKNSAKAMALAICIGILAIAAGLVPAQAASDEDDCKGPTDDCVAVGRWNFSIALGAGVRTNPLVNGKAIPLVVIPQFSYYGKRFFIDNLDLGVTLAESATNTLNLIATPGYDRVYFYRTDLQNLFVGFPVSGYNGVASRPFLVSADTPGAVKVPPPAPRITYLGGAEWTFKYAGVSGQLDLLRDITGQNNGDEIRAALGIPLIRSTGTWSANIGFTWKSAGLVNYYYGVPAIYAGSSALDPFVKLGYTVPLAGKWRFEAFAEYERLANAIADSPIVSEHHVETVFVGAIRTF